MNHNKWAKQNHPPARVKARVVTITSGLPSPWADEADHEATSDEAGSFFKKTTAISVEARVVTKTSCFPSPWADEADQEATSDEAESFFKKTTATSDNFPHFQIPWVL
ncbi:uncharacterized protein LOC119187395 isoform X5 [Rhipicephalus microplus]|uniref:uncharacterized protein LOC119187395 isoform X5 n=1 Tax=Rhipicephalus microplus TaxID=6941 RepID=UPI003F6BE4C9